ncbi:hypothetical protein BXY66_2100 [Shimia isoporae]|uniref:Uncharacterized protein n=1 Tax=Shimia isoporae TaxID=647720 RepID=A0A4R1NXW1_9RHOB|nr:hypothetical protein [Shimia isoporae]TCL10032.1 hypothetical protein BXY66_2100 [Shimia isoporae]
MMSQRSRKRRRLIYRGLILLFAVSVLPVLLVVASSLIANVAGCTLHEGFVTECGIIGVDFGPLLHSMFTSGWFFLMTAPVAVAALVGLVIMAAIDLWRRAFAPRD